MIAAREYLESIPNLVIVVPVTTVERGLPHQVRLRGPLLGLTKPSWGLTEQPRTITRERLTPRPAGSVDGDCLTEVDQRLRDFLGLH